MMVFLDPQRVLLGGGNRALETLWRGELAKADLFYDVSHSPLLGSIRACDATGYHTNEPIGLDFIRVGEAAFSLDPLSSTGVEKAMQTGLAAAVALHTMMLRPERSDLCLKFYRDRHFEAVSQHAIWSAGFIKVSTDITSFRSGKRGRAFRHSGPQRRALLRSTRCHLRTKGGRAILERNCGSRRQLALSNNRALWITKSFHKQPC
jgi:hypothetical protein